VPVDNLVPATVQEPAYPQGLSQKVNCC